MAYYPEWAKVSAPPLLGNLSGVVLESRQTCYHDRHYLLILRRKETYRISYDLVLYNLNRREWLLDRDYGHVIHAYRRYRQLRDELPLFLMMQLL